MDRPTPNIHVPCEHRLHFNYAIRYWDPFHGSTVCLRSLSGAAKEIAFVTSFPSPLCGNHIVHGVENVSPLCRVS